MSNVTNLFLVIFEAYQVYFITQDILLKNFRGFVDSSKNVHKKF